MGYLEGLAERVGAATIRSLSVRPVLATRDGTLLGSLPPAALQWGEGVADCCRRAAQPAGLGGDLQISACLAVRSDPARECAGPGELRRQDIEVAVWAAPGGRGDARGALPPPAPGDADLLAGFRSSGRPAFEPVSASDGAVPDSHSPDAYWRGLRRRVGTGALIIPAVAALVFDGRGGLILVRTRTWDRWMIPGGALELGETAADTAVRKVREETGLAAQPYALLGAYSGAPFVTRYPNGDLTQHVSTPMLCRITGGRLRPDVAEVREVRAFGAGALPPMFPQWARIARDALGGRSGHVA